MIEKLKKNGIQASRTNVGDLMGILWESYGICVVTSHRDFCAVSKHELTRPTLHSGLFRGLVYALSMCGSSHHASYQPAESKVSG